MLEILWKFICFLFLSLVVTGLLLFWVAIIAHWIERIGEKVKENNPRGTE
ncbi:hypothetical protein RFF58_09810 [Streptococcus ruminantium]|nr:hypothetical protein [Streptococcus ruminantium]